MSQIFIPKLSKSYSC